MSINFDEPVIIKIKRVKPLISLDYNLYEDAEGLVNQILKIKNSISSVFYNKFIKKNFLLSYLIEKSDENFLNLNLFNDNDDDIDKLKRLKRKKKELFQHIDHKVQDDFSAKLLTNMLIDEKLELYINTSVKTIGHAQQDLVFNNYKDNIVIKGITNTETKRVNFEPYNFEPKGFIIFGPKVIDFEFLQLNIFIAEADEDVRRIGQGMTTFSNLIEPAIISSGSGCTPTGMALDLAVKSSKILGKQLEKNADDEYYNDTFILNTSYQLKTQSELLSQITNDKIKIVLEIKNYNAEEDFDIFDKTNNLKNISRV